MVGDRSLFADAQGIERLWEVSGQLLDQPPEVHRDPQQSWGPEAIHKLSAPWRLPFQRNWPGPRTRGTWIDIARRPASGSRARRGARTGNAAIGRGARRLV